MDVICYDHYRVVRDAVHYQRRNTDGFGQALLCYVFAWNKIRPDFDGPTSRLH